MKELMEHRDNLIVEMGKHDQDFKVLTELRHALDSLDELIKIYITNGCNNDQ